ncbi:hypothetical protein [Chitinophaga rhizophila]|uniref:Uncharacterized protein n=1 Tax=Chitinophaga rhizophila TaxID=2866212 RepID=A0ABS7GH18_9BACT|nr:hypothetical protein [Chitinophaga rhizophila]MBW8685783.1 hypothetical protein [Chitinophaga rhizophila]
MTLFTPLQLRVLKTSWIPVLIIWLLSAGIASGMFPSHFTTVTDRLNMAFLLPLLTTAVWEMLVRKEWKNVAVLSFVIVLVAALQQVLKGVLHEKTDQDMAFLIEKINVFAGFLIVFITRFYCSGMGDKLVAGFLAALIYFVLPLHGVPLNSLQLVRDQQIYALIPSSVSYILTLPAAYCAFISYYVLVYLLENTYRWQHFRLLLQSRVQLLTRWEYFFLFLSVCFVYAGAIGVLDTNIYLFFEEGPQPVPVAGYILFSTLGMILLLYTGAGLLRNVITSRALTVGKYSWWVLLLHFIPVVNIAAMAHLFFSADKPATAAAHAATYMQQNRRLAQYTMIVAGILVTVFNLYMLLTQPTGLRLPAIGLLGALYLLKIYTYTRLRLGKSAVMAVMLLNVFTVLFAGSAHLILVLAALYLYYYLLLELFSPKLEIEDTLEIRQPDTTDIYTHTA